MSHKVTLSGSEAILACENMAMPVSDPGPTLDELVAKARQILVPAGLAPNEAEITIAAALERSRGDLELARLLGRRPTPVQVQRIRSFTAQRARRVPLQYLTGTAGFYGHEFEVGPGVFIPRPETETLVTLAIKSARDCGDAPVIYDLGSGTGAIAASIAVELPDARVTAVESSPNAWPWLRQNLRRIAPRVRAHFGDWHRLLAGLPSRSVDVLVSNPPYVPDREIPRDPEVRLFDPETALYSGSDGLDDIRQLAADAARLLRPGGSILVEHTEQQGELIRELFVAAGLQQAQTHPDLTGRERITSAKSRLD